MLNDQERGALIGQLAAALVNLDHCSRRLQTGGNFKHDLKRQLNLLQLQGEKLLDASQKLFDCHDADSINALSDVLGMAGELLLQLTPAQIESSLAHMHNMAQSNLAYLPAPIPYASAA
ncbi:hypothetical protein [Hymenobacter tenuis]